MNRRTFLATLLPAVRELPAVDRRPNILLILADDLGFSDPGCFGGELETPHLDELARSGVRFTQFYNGAICLPTRAALLTGLYSHQADCAYQLRDLGVPGYRGRIHDRCVTLGEALKPAGYRTLLVGKWHVGMKRPNWPLDRGFDDYFGVMLGGQGYFGVGGDTMIEGDRPVRPEEPFYMTDLFNDRAAAWVERYARAPEPFFLYLAHLAPHWPLHALKDDIARFRGRFLKGWDQLRRERYERQVKMGFIRGEWPLPPREQRAVDWSGLSAREKEAWDLRMAVYAAQIYRMDAGIGRIVAKLKETGAFDNTLILFLSDNGGCAQRAGRAGRHEKPEVPPGPADSFLAYGPSWANLSNTPFRGYKGGILEGGIASPSIVSWPAGIPKRGGWIDQVAHVIDVMPTFLEAAGAAYPEARQGKPILPAAGTSFLPTLRDARPYPRDPLFWERGGGCGVRQGDWKLVRSSGGRWELHDMGADRTEMRDLAGKDPRRAAQLARDYEAWAQRVNVLPYDKLRSLAAKS